MVTLSGKGQVGPPKQARARLQLLAGAKFVCRVGGDSIVLSLKARSGERPKLIFVPATGLRITQSPPAVQVSSEDVRAALADFP